MLTAPEQTRPCRWIWAVAVAAAFYTAVSAPLVLGRIRHYTAVLLLIQHAAILPAIWMLLRGAASAARPAGKLPLPRVRVLLACFLGSSLLLSWHLCGGLVMPDESAYRFQSRIFALGHLTAEAPPGASKIVRETPPELYFENHVMQAPRWFAKYPPAWPLVLSAGTLLHLEWAVNPLLGTLLLWLIFQIAGKIYDRETAVISILLALLSPYFLIHGVGLMSHALSGCLVAAACLALVRGLATMQAGPISVMWFLLACACQVRPFTGAIAAVALGLASSWYLRRTRGLLIRAVLPACVFGLLAIGGVLTTNHIYSGKYLLSPYALARGSSHLAEITFSPAPILDNIAQNMRFGTAFFVVPFLFLLAAYAIWREKLRVRETWILTFIYPALVVGYVLQTEASGSVIGERYYFEGFFAVVILGARGLVLLLRQSHLGRREVAALLAVLITVQLCEQAFAFIPVVRLAHPYRQVRAASDRLQGQYLVFLRDNPSLSFTAKHFNLNQADWKRAERVYLVDPGAARRAAWACRLGRSRWAVIGYDDFTQSSTEEFGGTGSAGCPAGRVKPDSASIVPGLTDSPLPGI